MCGIAGIFNFNQEPVAYRQIKDMTDSIAHRGPDGEGVYVKDHVGLGHRRLSVIDLSNAGHQPMQTRDARYIFIYNGEVYNFHELRVELESYGYIFHSNTDSEVVLNAFAHWGKDCLNRFNGMFAFAVWDQKEDKIFLARDRYGIKPLYYYVDHKRLIFASEIKALIASGLYESSLDKEGLVEYLTFQNFFTDKTLFKNVKTLKAGSYAEFSKDKKFVNHQYWDFKFDDGYEVEEAKAIEEIDGLFNQAVQRQLISDVSVNSYLSGGIDSGAITMIASKYLKNLKTFTVGFDMTSVSGLELSFDERTKAEHISYLAKTEHYEMVLKAGDMQRCMDKVVWHLEEPRVGQSYPNYYAAKLSSKFGKVVLAGTGGDELFAGYPWRYFQSEKSLSYESFIDAYYLKWQRLLPNSVLKEVLAPIWEDVKHVWTRDIFSEIFKPIYKPKLKPSDYLNYSLYLESKTFLQGLLIVEDKLSMAHGLETRLPFLDNDFVDFAIKIPSRLKIQNHVNSSTIVNENNLAKKKEQRHTNGKYILRKTLNKYLDNFIVNGEKQGFTPPDLSWYRGESIDYVRTKINIMPQSLFNKEKVSEIFEMHFNENKNYRLFLWSYISLIHSFEKFGLLLNENA